MTWRAQVLADRLCIASRGRLAAPLSAQSMISCDAHDAGCHGGFLDNAWHYLTQHGVPRETCLAYRHCDNPALPNCSFGHGAPPPPRQPPALGPLPANTTRLSRPIFKPHSPSAPPVPPVEGSCSRCDDGTRPELWGAESAYAVADVGDTQAMMAELVTRGPIQVRRGDRGLDTPVPIAYGPTERPVQSRRVRACVRACDRQTRSPCPLSCAPLCARASLIRLLPSVCVPP